MHVLGRRHVQVDQAIEQGCDAINGLWGLGHDGEWNMPVRQKRT